MSSETALSQSSASSPPKVEAPPTTRPNFRMQSAMVLFELEQALGAFVAEGADGADDVPESMRQELTNRSKAQGLVPEAKESLGSMIQETYISEIIDLALTTSGHRSDYRHLKQLKSLVEGLDLFAIRNAVCHPNRPFPECFWHRIAVIATDPTVDSLRLTRVQTAFRMAQDGRITPPPEDWLLQKTWAVPNNVPDSFDHEITGLIGRDRELQKLFKYLANARFALIAIVGPGGCGKTALCMQALNDCSFQPASLEWTDEIVYVTAKTERLTAHGLRPIDDPVMSLNDVREEVADALKKTNDVPHDTSFDDACTLLEKRRILLCIDNLETLLRDHPNSFDEFFADLPQSWRVLVTSRIAVNSATVLPLDKMSVPGAKRLARDYLMKRGAQRLPEKTLESLVNACDCNPLAVRLIIDSYVAGTELENALKETREKVLQFSYTSLLNALPETAIEILECLFGVATPIRRSDIGYFLDLSVDQVAEAVSQLLQTSLITRHSGSELEAYSLSSSVHDLLLRFPKNAAVRTKVHEKLRKQRQVVGTISKTVDANTTDPLAWNYIPPTAPDHVKEVLVQVFRSVRLKERSELLIESLDRVNKAVQREPNEVILFRASGHLLLRLLDRYGALDAFRRACESEGGDRSAALTLAELLWTDRELEDAQRYSAPLIEAGFANPDDSSVQSARRLLKVHWVVANWLDRNEEAAEASANWKDAGELMATLGCIRVNALLQSHEKNADSSQFGPVVVELLYILDHLFANEGHVDLIVHEGFKVIEEIFRFAKKVELRPKCCATVCAFLDQHLLAMCATHKDHSVDRPEVQAYVEFFRTANCGDSENKLATERWKEILLGEEDEALGAYGYVTATVYAGSRKKDGMSRSYLFARGSDGIEYFVARSSTSMKPKEFDALEEGHMISVKPAEEGDPDKAWPVRDAMPL